MLSSGESEGTIQQLLPSEGAESLEFSDELMKKIQLLQGLDTEGEGVSDRVNNNSSSDTQLHKIADLISSDKIIKDFSSRVGKGLPQERTLDKEIDLENTLETLTNVLNTLDESEQEMADVFTQIDSSIEMVESIKKQRPENVEIISQLEQIVEKLEVLKTSGSDDKLNNEIQYEQGSDEIEVSNIEQSQILSLLDKPFVEHAQIKNLLDASDLKQDPIKHFETIRENVEQVKKLLSNEADIISTAILDESSLQNEQIAPVPLEVTSKIANDVEKLSEGIESIKRGFSQKFWVNVEENQVSVPVVELLDKQEMNTEDLIESIEKLLPVTNNQIENRIVVEDDSVKDESLKQVENPSNKQEQEISYDIEDADIDREIVSLLTSLREPKQIENEILPLASQDATPLKNKENLSMKQLLAQQNAGFSVKTEDVDDSLSTFQLENKVGKNTLDSLFMNRQIQNEQVKVLDSNNSELITERVLPKFATDIAHLSRAVMAENKAEIPPMTKHFAHPEWNKEMGDRVIWMHKQAIPSAELRLNPGHLGPITIKIDVTQDQTTIAFTAQHAAVKEAIEAALPKLREMFSAQQLNLAEVNVSQEDAGQKQQRGFSQMGQNAGKDEKQQNNIIENEQAEINMDISDEIEAGRAISSSGLLSIFA